jgi:hypothetical protein
MNPVHQRTANNGSHEEHRKARFLYLLYYQRVNRPGRRIRAFGETVALLRANGNSGATVRLEHLWNEFRRTQPFVLFCAHTKSSFTDESDTSLREICDAHTKAILAAQS